MVYSRHRPWICACLVLLAVVRMGGPGTVLGGEPLPSWNEGAVRTAILDFVARVTRERGPDFVPIAERIAVFDNDGTLWSEQPMYFQSAFAIDRVKALAIAHPEWKDQQPYKAALEGDTKTVFSRSEAALAALVMASHSGITTDELEVSVKEWLATARHPRFQRPYTDLVFQPMLEVLDLFRENGFKTYIVSGGGIEFMRHWVPRTYGIPPEQIVGSSLKLKYELRDGKPILRQLPELDFLDDRAGKPVAIQKFIGRRPIAAFGNSDGDFEMLEWTTTGIGQRFGLVVHHTDAERDWAYDRNSSVGRLDKVLDEAPRRGWTMVDMQRDWKVIYPFQK
jgi:hypothetical protein